MSINSSPANYSGCSSTNSHRYEEFLSDSIECPTCRGLGRIKKGNEELVALIPVNDTRLKPRRTVLYVVIAVIICSLIAGLLLFFLVSRTVTLSSSQEIYAPISLDLMPDKEQLYMEYQVPINVSNSNYLSISVNKLVLTSTLYGEMQLNVSTNSTPLTVPMRGTRTHYVTVQMTVGTTARTRAVVKSCQIPLPSILWKMDINFDIDASISYLSHTESSSITLYNRKVCCHVPTNSTIIIPPADLVCATAAPT